MEHRPHTSAGPRITAGNLTLDLQRREALVSGHQIYLTPTEYEVLAHLAANCGKVLRHHRLLTAVWGEAWSSETAHLHVIVHKLRRKLDQAGSNLVILTKRSIGYMLDTATQVPQTNASTRTNATMNPMARTSAGDPGHTGPLLLIGLDCETSSADLSNGGRLIQAGAAAWSNGPGSTIDVYSSLIRHDTMNWDPAAANVHHISPESVANAPAPGHVDEQLHAWLCNHGADPDSSSVIPIGFNVTSFDLPFFRHTLPRSSALLSHRGIDLNSICFTYADLTGPRDFHHYKEAAKAYANEQLEQTGQAVHDHDAGHDAAQALLAWWYLKQQFTA